MCCEPRLRRNQYNAVELRIVNPHLKWGLVTTIKVNNWNEELSPWNAPAVFGNEGFGSGAEATLKAVLDVLDPFDKTKNYYIGGYSLAGLFALWSACQTDVFAGVAAASPSIWFPGFIDYMKEHAPHTGSVYLSLGDREEKIRNPVMSTVENGQSIRMGYQQEE